MENRTHCGANRGWIVVGSAGCDIMRRQAADTAGQVACPREDYYTPTRRCGREGGRDRTFAKRCCVRSFRRCSTVCLHTELCLAPTCGVASSTAVVANRAVPSWRFSEHTSFHSAGAKQGGASCLKPCCSTAEVMCGPTYDMINVIAG